MESHEQNLKNVCRFCLCVLGVSKTSLKTMRAKVRRKSLKDYYFESDSMNSILIPPNMCNSCKNLLNKEQTRFEGFVKVSGYSRDFSEYINFLSGDSLFLTKRDVHPHSDKCQICDLFSKKSDSSSDTSGEQQQVPSLPVMEIDNTSLDEGDLEPRVLSDVDVNSSSGPSGVIETPKSPNMSIDIPISQHLSTDCSETTKRKEIDKSVTPSASRGSLEATKSIEEDGSDTISVSRGSLDATLDATEGSLKNLSIDSVPLKERFGRTNEQSAVMGEF